MAEGDNFGVVESSRHISTSQPRRFFAAVAPARGGAKAGREYIYRRGGVRTIFELGHFASFGRVAQEKVGCRDVRGGSVSVP